jgi:CMP-N,N'-diacetyllegionaminic acid synthase
VTDDILALIPARGGSRGIPRKNLIDIAGKPLIGWSIEHARTSQRITRVIVSTDDREIADVAAAFGAEVPFLRPPEFAADDSPDLDVFRHALNFLADTESKLPDIVVHLRPTGPLRRSRDIDDAIDLLASRPDVDAVRSVSVVHQTPYKMWRITDDGLMEPLLRIDGMPDCQSQPRQLLPFVYHQNGYVDLLRPRAVLEKNSMWGERVLPFIVETGVLDLDYPEDIAPMEHALEHLEDGINITVVPSGRHPV